ncbi:CBS domain-containing protein [Streptomyces sp. NPDC096094]|uniref:CBS domain-containing protein n=1 Tax=Streptomyces sp. NPDC096094 TaxID=3366073 RepID=UPI0037F36F9C
MTLLQTHPRPASTNADAVHRTAADAMDAAGPQVWDDMTVEVALSVMAAARTDHLVVCDEDGQYTALVTRARLAAVRNGSAYTDRVRLRDIADGDGSFASPLTTVAEAEHAMRHRRLGALPVVDEYGNALGVLALSR